MKWSELQNREADLTLLWKSKGITWSIRSALGAALDDFVEDPNAKKNDNLAGILSKVPSEQREQIEASIGLSRTRFYDKLLAGLAEEKAMVPVTFNDDYSTPMEVDVDPVVEALAFFKTLQ